jgi:hypothetical protein
MKRLIYCVMAALLISAPGLCFGRSPQALGEMLQLGPKAPTPTQPENVRTVTKAWSHRRTNPSTSGGMMTLSKERFLIPAKKPDGPAFTVYGDDSTSESDDKSDVSAGNSQTPQTAPAKTDSKPQSAQTTPSPAPHS